MKEDIVKCTKCGAYNDISGISLYVQRDSHEDDIPIKVICENCGERIDL